MILNKEDKLFYVFINVGLKNDRSCVFSWWWCIYLGNLGRWDRLFLFGVRLELLVGYWVVSEGLV